MRFCGSTCIDRQEAFLSSFKQPLILGSTDWIWCMDFDDDLPSPTTGPITLFHVEGFAARLFVLAALRHVPAELCHFIQLS
jgi:hypothetical protein